MAIINNNANNIKPVMPPPQSAADVNAARIAKQEQALAASQAQASIQAQAVSHDRIEISRQASSVNNAVQAANELPDVRQALVQKASVDRAEHQSAVSPQLLAQKMLFQDNIK
jgi:hypothetical protein